MEMAYTGTKVSRWVSGSGRCTAEVAPMDCGQFITSTSKHIGDLCKDYRIFQVTSCVAPTKARLVSDVPPKSDKSDNMELEDLEWCEDYGILQIAY